MPSIPIAKVEKFVSNEEARYNLSHVWLDAEGQRLAASNGHVLVVARVTIHEGETSGYIPVLAFEQIRKMIQRHKKESEFPHDKLITMKAFADQIVIANDWTHESYTIQRPSFGEAIKFPKFDSIIPEAKGVATVSVNRGYMASLCKELGGDSDVFSLWVESAHEGVLISGAESDAIAVLMPMKYDTTAQEVLKKSCPVPVEELAAV